MALLNWIDSEFFGYRRVIDSSNVELPERPYLKLTGAINVTDDPLTKSTVITMDSSVADATPLAVPDKIVRRDVAGGAAFAGILTAANINASGDITVGGSLESTGNITSSGDVECVNVIASGSLEGTSLTLSGGIVSGGAISGTSLTLSGNASVGGTLTVSGASTLQGVSAQAISCTGLTTSGTISGTTLSISGTSSIGTVSVGENKDLAVSWVTKTSDTVTRDFLVDLQSPFSTAVTNKRPGNFVLRFPNPAGGSTDPLDQPKVSLLRGGFEHFRVVSNATYDTTLESPNGSLILKTLDQTVSTVASKPLSVISGNTSGTSAPTGSITIGSGTTAGGSSNTGMVSMRSGASSLASSGSASFGSGNAAGSSGTLVLSTGSSSGASSGSVSISTGSASGGGANASGNVLIATGTSATSSGSVTLSTGTGSGNAGGDIILQTGGGGTKAGDIVMRLGSTSQRSNMIVTASGASISVPGKGGLFLGDNDLFPNTNPVGGLYIFTQNNKLYVRDKNGVNWILVN